MKESSWPVESEGLQICPMRRCLLVLSRVGNVSIDSIKTIVIYDFKQDIDGVSLLIGQFLEFDLISP